MTAANDRITVSMSEGVADVRLVRGDKMNALDAAMFDALVDTAAKLKTEKGLRAVVLSGEGRAFCAGLDMGRFAAMATAPVICAISLSARTDSQITRSRQCGAGGSCRCR